ncbi:SAM-dependent methyltransferase [Actinomadura violacea]|uniref:SAM-dependent methyltransferase n=1 Tax=Actinomadura violacea TaxID=2819934 RepID=A0ABS3RXS7_9ACTN|nr:SAM-dependent methyltransferase [Actinomadura violacea]MBO2461562.1 SAM-dependent methyltransferase [Actinomadura violacea]
MTASDASSFDTTVANVARTYDFYLGGDTNFPVDRELAEQTLKRVPQVREMARENRAVLQRMTRYLAEQCGIRRFLDIGAGLPTRGQVHEVAQATDPDVHVVYVDYDPVVILHSQVMLMPHQNVHIIRGDVRDPAEILTAPEVRELLSPGEPVALLLFAIMQFVPEHHFAYRVVAELVDALPPGSYVAMSHPVRNEASDPFAAVVDLYANTDTATIAKRTPDGIARFFTGLDMVEPGLVPVNEWRHDGQDAVDVHGWNFAGLARKP